MLDVARPAANDGVFRWKLVAGLASFAAVAAIGCGALGSIGPQPGAGAQLARSAAPAVGTTQVMALAAPVPAASQAADMAPVMLRDARLDELLAAHRQTVGASALGNAAGFFRNATFEGPGRRPPGCPRALVPPPRAACRRAGGVCACVKLR